MQTTAHARRPPLFTRHAVVAALIGLPVLPLAGGSQSIPSETISKNNASLLRM